MKIEFFVKISLCFLVLSISGLISLISGVTSFAYYDGEKKGWWWYAEPKKEEAKEEKKEVKKKEKKEEKKKEEKKEAKQEEEKEWKPSKPLEAYTYEELLKMPVKDFTKLFNYYRDLAISDPTNEKNIYYFYNLVDVARKKSLLFMANAMHVMNKYPELNVGKDVPTINPALKKKAELERTEEKRKLQKIGKNIGLIVFVKEGCPYCEVQLSIMDYFISQGIPVKVVDVDMDSSAVSRFAITTVPTIILVHKETGRYLPIAVGATSATELYERIATVSGYLENEKEAGQAYLYDFQKGTSLDPYVSPPLFKRNKK